MHPVRPIDWRLDHHVTQEELAELLGVDLRTVQRWESLERQPRQQRWPQLDAFDRGDLILVRPADGGRVQLAPAADHVAWRQAGAAVRRVGVAASPVQRAQAAIADVRSVDEVRVIIDLLQDHLRQMGADPGTDDGVDVAAAKGLTDSSQENTLAPEVEQVPKGQTSSTTHTPTPTPVPKRRGPGRPKVADALVTRTVQIAPEQDEAVQSLMAQGLSAGAAVRVLIGRATGRRWYEDPDCLEASPG